MAEAGVVGVKVELGIVGPEEMELGIVGPEEEELADSAGAHRFAG